MPYGHIVSIAKTREVWSALSSSPRPLVIRDLVRLTGVSMGQICHALAWLEELGYIDRLPSPRASRAIRVRVPLLNISQLPNLNG